MKSSGKNTLNKYTLGLDYLLGISMSATQVSKVSIASYNKFASKLIKHKGIHAIIFLKDALAFDPSVKHYYSYPLLKTSLLSEFQSYNKKQSDKRPHVISRRTKLYKLISAQLKIEKSDIHIFPISKNVSTFIVCNNQITNDKNFKKFSSIVISYSKHLNHYAELDGKAIYKKKLQKENADLSSQLAKKSEYNDSIEFSKRIVALNSFPIVNVRRGKILSYNKALKKLLQCSDKYLRETKYIDIIHPEDQEEIINLAMKFILGQEKAVTIQVKILTSKLKVKNILMSMHSIPDDKGIHHYTNCTIYDITDQNKLRDQLIKSQDQYKLLVEATPAGIIQTDAEGVIQFSSPKATEIFRHKKNQLLGINIKDLIKTNSKKEFQDALNSLDSNKSKFIGEFECNSKNKEKLYIRCSLGILIDEHKKTTGYFFAFVDATQEIESNRETVVNQATLYSIINSTNDALIAYDKDYKVLMANKLARKYISSILNIDIKIGETIDKKYRKHFAEKSTFNPKNEKYLKDLKKIRNHKFDGKDLFIQISHSLITDKEGNVIGVLESGKDITELIAKEQLLVKSESRYRFLVENMNAGVSLIRTDGSHEFINQKGLDIFGLKENAKQLKLHFKSLFHDEEFKRFKRVKKSLNPSEKYKAELYKAWNSKGETVYLDLSISRADDQINSEAQFLLSYTDVTETIQVQKELTNRQATLNAVLNSTPNGIFAIDKKLNIISVNRQAILDFKNHLNVHVAVGINLNDVIKTDTLNKWQKSYFNKVFKGESFKYIGPSVDNNYYLENSYAPVITENGDIIGCLEVSEDISDIKRQEIALKESEQKYRLLVETSPAGILQAKISGEIEFISQKGAEMLGYSVEDCIGINSLQFIHPDDHKKVLQALKELFDGKENQIVTVTAITKQGKQFKAEGSSKLVKNKDGRTKAALVIFHDVTEKETARLELASTQAYFSKMYENTFDPIFVYDYEREKIIECNNAALKLFGYKTKKEIKALNRFDLIPNKTKSYPELQQHNALRIHSSVVKENKTLNINGVMLTKSGKELIVSVNVIPTHSNGTEAFVIVHDNTDRVKSFRELEKSKKEIEYERALYEAVIKNSFDGVDITEFTLIDNKYKKPKLVLRNDIMKKFLVDDNKTYSTAEELLELRPTMLNGENNSDSKFPELKKSELKEMLRNIFLNKNIMPQFNLRTDEDEFLAVESSHKIINFYDNAYMIRNYKNITERIKQEEIIKLQIENLNEKNKELQGYIESNMQLENFAYIASHDLKAPLRSVSSFAHLLKTNCYESLDTKGKRFLDIISESAMNMQRLIDDLLDYSRINTENIRKAPLDLNRLLVRIQTDLHLEIQKTKTEIKIDNLPNNIFADESMMIQVFQNLITNAMKFVKKGDTPKISISATLEGQHFHFIVKDKGIGIAPENVNKIFGIFSKLHSNDTYSGTGLGLTICKTIVERHNGTIWVESKLNKGSEFHFTIQSTN